VEGAMNVSEYMLQDPSLRSYYSFNRFTDTFVFSSPSSLVSLHPSLFLFLPALFSFPLSNPLLLSSFVRRSPPPRQVLYCTLYEKFNEFPISSRDVTNQTLPGRKQFNYSQAGRVWLVTSRMGTGKLLAFFYSVPPLTPRGRRSGRKHRGVE
jgi:hypothetical protein